MRAELLVDKGVAPTHRAVVLGASNVARGIAVVLDTSRFTWGAPLDLMTALGHGRSYGLETRILGRSLPSILECGLWSDWDRRASLPTAALLTDVGNDLFFGMSVPQIGDWVSDALRRLARRCERTIVSELPLANTRALGSRRYLLLRSIFFPRSKLGFEQAVDNAHRLNDLLIEIARDHGAELVRPSSEWYGLDPIHIRPALAPRAWRELLMPWRDVPIERTAQTGLWDWVRISTTRPHQRRLFGIAQRCEQPALRLPDGSQVSLY